MLSSSVRIKILTVVFVVFACVITARLFTWQVLQNEGFSVMAKSQQQISSTLSAQRGAILASDNFPLAASSPGWLLYAETKKIQNPNQIAEKLAPIVAPDPFIEENDDEEGTPSAEAIIATESAQTKEELVEIEEERLAEQLNKSDVVWVALKKKLNNSQKEQIEALKIEGLGFNLEESRSYPEGSLASHLLGFVGQDAGGSDKGYFGLEGYYNLTLAGTSGTKAWEKDASGKPILLGDNRQITALNGLSLKTHIDRSVQFILERHLKEGIKKYDAVGGTILVMRPKDGAIIGMASSPSYEPATFGNYKNDRFIDPGVSQSFEPGSIFKVLVMAWAFDSKTVKPDDKCDNCAGPRKFADFTIKSATQEYYADTNMEDVIKHSDNIGMIWVAEKMGFEKFYEYLNKFGFGSLTGTDLQGEISPPLRNRDSWGIIDLATASFGQGIAVTSLQMVKAMSALANGGRMATPQVVDKIVGDGWEEDIKPEVSDQLISQDAVDKITDIMINNVESRTDWEKVNGIKMAGKTGTAQVAIAGHYDPDKTVASFLGFAPANDPQYVMIVSLKDPKAAPFASQTAAPLWFAISKDLLAYLGTKSSN